MRHAAASASSATPVECPRSHGDFRSVNAAIGRECGVDPARRRSRSAADGSPSSACSQSASSSSSGEQLVEVPHRQLGEARVVGGARSALDDGARASAPARREEQRDVSGHVQESGRERDRLARRRRETRARPSARTRTRAQPRCPGSRPSQPANRCATSQSSRMPRGPSARVRERLLDHRGADLGRPPDPDVGPVERERPPPARSGRRGRTRPGGDVVAEELRRLVPVRGAAGGVQERDVVGVRELLARTRPASSPRRTASTAVRSACSSGWPVPRSVASDSARDHLGCADRLLSSAGRRTRYGIPHLHGSSLPSQSGGCTKVATEDAGSRELVASQAEPAGAACERGRAWAATGDRREFSAALRDFAGDEPRAQATRRLLGLLEHLLCAVEVLRPAARSARGPSRRWVRARNSGAPSRSSISAAAAKWPSACS